MINKNIKKRVNTKVYEVQFKKPLVSAYVYEAIGLQITLNLVYVLYTRECLINPKLTIK